MLEGEQHTLGLQVLLGGWLPLPQGPLAALGVQCRTVAGRAVLVARLDEQSLLVGDRLPPVTQPLPLRYLHWSDAYEPLLIPGERATVEQVTLLVDQGRLWVQPTINPVFGSDPGLRLPLALLSEREAVLIGTLADSGPVIRWQRLADGRDGLVYTSTTYVRVQL